MALPRRLLYMRGEMIPKDQIVFGESGPRWIQFHTHWQVPLVVEDGQGQFMSLLNLICDSPRVTVINLIYDKKEKLANNAFTSTKKILITPWRLILFGRKYCDL